MKGCWANCWSKGVSKVDPELLLEALCDDLSLVVRDIASSISFAMEDSVGVNHVDIRRMFNNVSGTEGLDLIDLGKH